MSYNRTAKPGPNPQPSADGPLTDVCYRTYPASKQPRPREAEVIAVFPGLPGTRHPYTCSCYMHCGQHSSCDPYGVVADTRPATPAEYAPLHRELTAVVGYNLRIVTRANRQHYTEQRRAELAAMSNPR